MSMLQEKRRKVKWSLNPRGTAWSKDNNKFGQRLLEKMGWKEGCGLGAKLQGPVEHVKVTFKNDSKGIGFKEGSEEWTEHQSNFDSLLTQLNGGRSENKGVTSLEQVSRRSRARLQ
uniref:G-patch domain-containing protein n=1 Tax=Timema bartmani TaxID=61472 RepID=A0A7R9HYC7_9NEOP|nr:unnamed protein product [Timema bartmani]